MKLKGIGKLEQGVEKIVLAVFMVMLLAVVAMQFLSNPNAVDVGGREVTPEGIYEVLRTRATEVRGEIDDPSPALPEIDTTDLMEVYQQRLVDPVAPAPRLAATIGARAEIGEVIGGAGTEIVAGTGGRVAGLSVPAPTGVLAVANWSTLDPYYVAGHSSLSEYVPAEQPYDLASVTVEVAFDGGALREALTRPGGEGTRSIPRQFWSASGMAVLDYAVERQRLLPDGSWSASEPISRLPEQEPAGSRVSAASTLKELVDLTQETAREADRAYRPDFAPAISGLPWYQPTKMVQRLERLDDMVRLAELEARRDRIEGDIARLSDRQDRRRTTQAPRPSLTPQTAPGGRGTPGRGGGARDQRPVRQRDPAAGSRTRLDRLQQDLAEVNEQITRLQTELDEMFAEEADVPTGSRRLRGVAQEGDLLGADRVPMWAHDIGVVPGQTYRYRVRVGVNNPLFRKQTSLDPNDPGQLALATEPLVYSGWSSWSEPVAVGARTYFVVTRGSEGGQVGLPTDQAGARVFTMHYGYYRDATVSLLPGDIVRADIELPDTLVTFDRSVLDRSAAGQALRDYYDADPADDSYALAEGLQPDAESVVVDLGVYFLDAAQRVLGDAGVLGQREPGTDVIFQAADGSLLVRDAERDNDAPVFELASDLARLGATAELRWPDWGDRRRPRQAPGQYFDPRRQDPDRPRMVIPP